MASINYAARQISVKIVYYGPGLSGKTTNLQVIHKKTPQEHRSDMVSLATETDRTLFFDFLPLDLGKIKGFATKFQLYTVPGQVYYNATRKLVLRGVDGVVFVADSGADKVQENLESFKNLEDNLAEYGYQKESVPIILQYNKRDLPNALPIDELNRLINKYNLPWGEGIAYKGVGVFDTLKQIGKIVIDYLNKKYSRSAPGGSRSGASAAPAGGGYQQPSATGAFPAYQPPPQQGFQQPPPSGSFPAYQPPQQQQSYDSFEPPTAQPYAAQGFQQPPPSGSFPAYQPPQQQQSYDSFEPPAAQPYAAQGFQQPPPSGSFPAYQPPQQQSYDSFEPPAAQPYAAQGFQQPPATGGFPAYQPPQQGYESFEPPAPAAQPYQAQGFQQPPATGGFPSYQPPQQAYDSFEPPAAQQPYQAAPSFDPYAQQQATPSFDPFAQQQAAPSFDPFAQQQAAPSFDPYAQQQAAPSFDPYAQQQAAPSFDPYAQQAPQQQWGAPAASAADDPFLQSPQAQSTPSFEPPPVSAGPGSIDNFDDMFMPESPPQPQQPPGMGGNQGGYAPPPFEVEMTPPPPSSHPHQPLAGATMGGTGLPNAAAPTPAMHGAPAGMPIDTGGQYQGYPAQQPTGQLMPTTPPPASQFEYSFNQQPFAPPPDAGFGGAPPQGEAAMQEGGSRSQLDREIEKYQQEIAEKQKKMRSDGGAWGGFPPPGAPGSAQEMPPYPDPLAGYDDPYQQAKAPPAQGIPTAQHSGAAPAPFQPEPFSPEPAAMAHFSPAPTGSMPAFSTEPMESAQGGGMMPTPQNSAIFEFEAELSARVNKNFDENEECPTDSSIFFSSVSRHGPKKPVKPPVNPVKLKNAQPPQKGLMSKLFNKNP